MPERETTAGNEQPFVFDMRIGTGFERTAVKVFTELIPVFELVDESIPER